MEHLASEIQRRANKQNISMSELCRLAGISRRWFECFKKRIPKSVDVYLKMDKQLKILEQKNNETN
jgi:RNA binding exosome subunit